MAKASVSTGAFFLRPTPSAVLSAVASAKAEASAKEDAAQNFIHFSMSGR
jgi:hypothetical protein